MTPFALHVSQRGSRFYVGARRRRHAEEEGEADGSDVFARAPEVGTEEGAPRGGAGDGGGPALLLATWEEQGGAEGDVEGVGVDLLGLEVMSGTHVSVKKGSVQGRSGGSLQAR